jgi:hypothetical protein
MPDYRKAACDSDDPIKEHDGILGLEHELAQLRSLASRRELARRQVTGVEAVAEQLRRHLDDPSFDTKQAILRLVVDKVVVTGRRLEIHLALPVNSNGPVPRGCRRR